MTGGLRAGDAMGRWRQYGVLLLLVQLMVACSPATPDGGNRTVATDAVASVDSSAANATQDAVDARLVVAFGDSLYAGYNLGTDEGFAPVLERALDAQGIKARVVNAGVSGDTSAAGRARLDFTLNGLPRKPDLVIVGLGGNDMLRGLSPKETRANLDAILAELKARKIPAMLTGMLAAPNLGSEYGTAFNAIYPDLAKSYDVPLYPFFLDGVLGDRALLLPDGIHPSAKGFAVVVDKIAPLVAKDLKN